MRRTKSPLSPVAPDDPPMRLCQTCGNKFNPYKFDECPNAENHDQY